MSHPRHEQGRRTRGTAALFLPVLFAVQGCYDDTPLNVAPHVDLRKFQGTWYEIAKLPRTTQAGCTGTVASYKLEPNGDLAVESHCHTGGLEGPVKSMTATGKVPDPAVPAKLALNFGGFYGDYFILEVGTNYEFAVVGHPSREYLWILSRTPTLSPPLLAAALTRAQTEKFDVDRLEYTLQPL
jgi:apolipoprotein D and lipocalin family protein